jgi:hypothetical protein
MTMWTSKLGYSPPKTRWGLWIGLFVFVWATLSIASFVMNSREGLRFPAAFLILGCLVGTICLMFMTMGFVLDKPKAILYAQDLHLTGSVLKNFMPSVWSLDLAAAPAYVLCLHKGAPAYASVRFLRDEGDISIYFHAPQSSVLGLWVSGNARHPPGRWLGTVEYRDKFGTAILEQLRQNKSQNRFWTVLQELSEAPLRQADDPDMVLLGDDDDDDSLSYRSHGKPGPKDPGFGAWLSSYGLQVSTDVFLSDQHLVAECTDGSRRAFPIGTPLRREPGGLIMTTGDETHSISIDAVVAEAILERVRGVTEPDWARNA